MKSLVNLSKAALAAGHYNTFGRHGIRAMPSTCVSAYVNLITPNDSGYEDVFPSREYRLRIFYDLTTLVVCIVR